MNDEYFIVCLRRGLRQLNTPDLWPPHSSLGWRRARHRTPANIRRTVDSSFLTKFCLARQTPAPTSGMPVKFSSATYWQMSGAPDIILSKNYWRLSGKYLPGSGAVPGANPESHPKYRNYAIISHQIRGGSTRSADESMSMPKVRLVSNLGTVWCLHSAEKKNRFRTCFFFQTSFFFRQKIFFQSLS